MIAELVRHEEQQHEQRTARNVRRDENQAPIEPVDVDAGDGTEDDRRHQEAQDQQADGRATCR